MKKPRVKSAVYESHKGIARTGGKKRNTVKVATTIDSCHQAQGREAGVHGGMLKGKR